MTDTESFVAQMESLAEELGVRDFDLMLAGDGSGTTCHEACGFACVAYNRRSSEAIVHHGGFNRGTNNLAELVPYVHALWHFHAANKYMDKPVRVLVVSDSELTVRQGTRQYVRNGNACFWAAIEWFEKNGFQFDWHHVYRNTNPVSTLCDTLAGETRNIFV